MLTYDLQFDTNASIEESLPMKPLMSTWAGIVRTTVLLSAALVLHTACSSGEPQKDFKQGQPPVVVVQAPGSTAAKDSKTDSSYAGLAWEAATSGAVGPGLWGTGLGRKRFPGIPSTPWAPDQPTVPA